MADLEEKGPSPVKISGKEYPPLADGAYDVCILGTGLKECVLGGLLQQKGMKVLQVDRYGYYGADCASLNLTNLLKHGGRDAGKEAQEKYPGRNRDYNVDLIPKFLMACGDLVKILLHTKVTRYLEFKSIGGSYVYKDGGKINKVPATLMEAAKTSLVGFFQKRKLKSFLSYLEKYDEKNPATHKGYDLTTMPMSELFYKYGLDANTQDFIGHAMALMPDESYKSMPAIGTVRAIQLYAYSLSQYGKSPYIYPVYGLGGLPESFSRLCAIHGGTFMLNQDCDEVLFGDDGKVAGVRCGDMAASTKLVIGDPSYFLNASSDSAPKMKKVGQVIRSICFLNHPIPKLTQCTSAQIIIPQNQVGRQSDIYVTCVSYDHMTVPKGMYVCIVSTTVETSNPSAEVAPGINMLGPLMDRFDHVSDVYEPLDDGVHSQCFVSHSMDASSHFGSTAADILDMYKRITGEELDMSINADTTDCD